MIGDAGYDVIEVDALRPYHASSGNLYSLEFFERSARKLKPGGIMCSWGPTPRAQATFVQAFPYVLDINNGQINLSPTRTKSQCCECHGLINLDAIGLKRPPQANPRFAICWPIECRFCLKRAIGGEGLNGDVCPG